MSPSPSGSNRSSRLVQELSRDLNNFRSQLSSVSPSARERDNTHGSSQDVKSLSNFDPTNDEIFQSTRQLDDTTKQLPNIRSSAQRYGYYNPPQPAEPRLNTSVIGREYFQDFDDRGSSEEDSIELGRGVRRSARNTPSKLNQSSLMSPNVLLSIGTDSLYEVTGTPGNRPKVTARKSDGVERGSLRRDAQIRRATSLPQKDIEAGLSRHTKSTERVSPGKSDNMDKHRNTLAKMHAKVTSEADSSFLDERPPTVTVSVKNTRFGNSRSRQTSLADNAIANNSTPGAASNQNAKDSKTPQRPPFGTPRSAAMTGNATQQSFMLPDLPNLTELVSGVYKDGTPVFSRNTKPRSRFASAASSRGAGNGQPNFAPIDSVPLPADEKAIFVSLQLLKEKVAQLEQEKAESDKRAEEYENEVIDLRTELQAQENLRRSDSALGSTDGEGRSEKGNWQVEKMRLESSAQSLQNRLDRAERKVSVSEIAIKRITQERDNLVTQVGTAFYTSEELKVENEALLKENETLRNEVQDLRAENEGLHKEMDELRERLQEEEVHLQDETQKWTTKEAELRRKIGKTDRAVLAENETLRAELVRTRAQYDEETQRWTRKEAELRKTSDKKAQAEHAKLRSENDALKAELAEAKARRQEEIRRWSSKEAEMRSKIERRDETIHQLKDMTQDDANEALRLENEELRVQLAHQQARQDEETQRLDKNEAELFHLRQQLAQVVAQRAEETQQWSRKEAQLRDTIEQREKAVKETKTTRRANVSESTRPPVKQTGNVNTNRQEVCRRPSNSGDRNASGARVSEKVGATSSKTRPASVTQPLSSHDAAQEQTSRTESKVRPRPASVPIPSKALRGTSAHDFAAEDNVEHEPSEAESTTDLSISRPAGGPYVAGANATTHAAATIEPPSKDITLLSFLDGNEIARLRRTLEEERVAARKRNSVGEQRQNDTVRSSTSAAPALPRKSSLKDMTASAKVTKDAKTATVEDADDESSDHLSELDGRDDAQAKEPTNQSVLSNTSRRRRSARMDMTSAFLLPDITMHATTRPELTPAAQAVLETLSPHNTKNCTICRRVLCTEHAQPGAPADSEPITIPTPVPVSTRPAAEDDADATMRPSQPAPQALAAVLKALEDELAHLKLELRAQETLLRAHDAALGKRRRKVVQRKIEELVRRIDVRADQIYALYDVLEAHKDDVDFAKREGEVEETLMSVGIDVRELGRGAGAGKRVVIDEGNGRGGKEDEEDVMVDGRDGSGSESEGLPWEGLSDTESLASRKSRRRSGAY